MIKSFATLASGLLLAATASDVSGQAVSLRDAQAWEIGPVIEGSNYSVGADLHPQALRSGGLAIDIPRAPGSVHYVTTPTGSLAGKRRIVMRYRVDMARGASLYATTAPPDGPAIITLYFQRAGDNWSGRRRFEAYRWYATFASQTPVVAGEHTIIAPLDSNWTAVERSSARTNPRAFASALAETGRVGFVLGGGDGFGHGVTANGSVRLVILDFKVE